MPQSKASILVVDDDATLRHLLVDTLSSIGYETDSAADGIEALGKLKDGKYDLMISDIRMPGVDGFGLLKRVRRRYPDLPVLFITGYPSPELIGRASPDGFLAKPFRISRIETLIEESLSARGAARTRSIRKVLLVDDDDFFREMMTEALRCHDYVPLAVTGGKHALRELGRGQVDAVITDIRMPDMDGLTLMRRIKAGYPRMPVILMTAYYASDDPEMQAGRADADGFLSKPFEVDHMIRALEMLARQTPIPSSG